MEALIQTEVSTKYLRYFQNRIAPIFPAKETFLMLLLRADIATCLYLFEQANSLITPKVLYY